MGWNALIDPRTAPGFGQAALGGVVILAITGIYGWYAHLHVLPIYWDTVVVALMTMGGFAVIGARSRWLLAWIMFPLWLSECQMDTVDTPLFRTAGDTVNTQGLRVHSEESIEVVIRIGGIRGDRERSRHIFAPVAPPEWSPGDPVLLWAHERIGEFSDTEPVLDRWHVSHDRVMLPSRKTQLSLPQTRGPFAEQARERFGLTRPAQVVQWREYHDDLPRAAMRAVIWPVVAMSVFWLLLVNHARRRALRTKRLHTGQ
jgi:hypothetical protein